MREKETDRQTKSSDEKINHSYDNFLVNLMLYTPYGKLVQLGMTFVARLVARAQSSTQAPVLMLSHSSCEGTYFKPLSLLQSGNRYKQVNSTAISLHSGEEVNVPTGVKIRFQI